MESVSSVITKKPFCDKLVTGNFTEKVLSCIDEYFSDKNEHPEIALLTTEKDYLFIGKFLKDKLIAEKKIVTAFVFEKAESINFLSDYDAVVTIGDADYVGAICVKVTDKPVIILSDCLVFANVFSFLYEVSPINKLKGDFYKCVIDTEIYKNLKRKDFADGYAFASSVCLAKFECEVLKTFGEEISDQTIDRLDFAYKTLTYINKENIVGVITVAEIYLMSALNLCPRLLDTGAFYCGKILSSITGLSKYECTLSSYGALLTAFKCYIKTDKDLAVVPFVREDAEKLSELLHVDSLEVYEKMNFLSYDKISSKRTALSGNKNLERVIDETAGRLKVLKAKYENVYNARHKRGECKKEDLLKALALSGVVAEGSTEIMYYDGFLSLLPQI